MGTVEATEARSEPRGATPSERAALGKAARHEAPRSSHGDWAPAADRPDPVEVLEAYTSAAVFDHQGQRVVEGQRVTQAASDILLGWLTSPGLDGKGHEFYVRQLWDEKGSFAIETMSSYAIEIYARSCGSVLARAHARTGDSIAIAAYLGNSDRFDHAIAEFAGAYADRNQRDYEELVSAAADGRVVAADDPRM